VDRQHHPEGIRSGDWPAWWCRALGRDSTTILPEAISGGDAYDEHFRGLIAATRSSDAYWARSCRTSRGPRGDCGPLREGTPPPVVPTASCPFEVARRWRGTPKRPPSSRPFLPREDQPRPTCFVKIPGHRRGPSPRWRTLIAEGRRHQHHADLSMSATARSEAYVSPRVGRGRLSEGAQCLWPSFFISRVDSKRRRRLEAFGNDEALALRGSAAVIRPASAYQQFPGPVPGVPAGREVAFGCPRWRGVGARR
jgi:transaldolase